MISKATSLFFLLLLFVVVWVVCVPTNWRKMPSMTLFNPHTTLWDRQGRNGHLDPTQEGTEAPEGVLYPKTHNCKWRMRNSTWGFLVTFLVVYSCVPCTGSHHFYAHVIAQSPEPDSSPLSSIACWRFLRISVTPKVTCLKPEVKIIPQNFVLCFWFLICTAISSWKEVSTVWKLKLIYFSFFHIHSSSSSDFSTRLFPSSPSPWSEVVSHQTHLIISLFLLPSTLVQTVCSNHCFITRQLEEHWRLPVFYYMVHVIFIQCHGTLADPYPSPQPSDQMPVCSGCSSQPLSSLSPECALASPLYLCRLPPRQEMPSCSLAHWNYIPSWRPVQNSPLLLTSHFDCPLFLGVFLSYIQSSTFSLVLFFIPYNILVLYYLNSHVKEWDQ